MIERSTLLLLMVLLLWRCGMTPEETAKWNADQAKCQGAIKQWIAAHAIHPKTYHPIVFDQFSIGRTVDSDTLVPGSECYTMRHVHRMLKNDGETATFSGYFLMDNEFRVGVIQVDGMNVAGVGTYPEWHAWTDLFGRPMTAQDSSEWRSRSDKRFLQEMEQVRESLNTGDAYVVGASEDSGKALMDTVINLLKR